MASLSYFSSFLEPIKQEWKKSAWLVSPVKVLVAHSCLTLCNPTDCGLPGSSVHGILQARVLEWVAISFSGDLPNPGIEPTSPTLQTYSSLAEPQGEPWLLLLSPSM